MYTPAILRYPTHCLFLSLAVYLTPTVCDQGGGPAKPPPADGEFYNPIPGDVLKKTQKASICAVVAPTPELCAVAGASDAFCTALSDSVNATDPQCDVRHVCSFQMPELNVPALNTTLAPHPAPTTSNEIVDLPRSPNRAYVSWENLDDLYIVKECKNSSLVVFVPEKISS